MNKGEKLERFLDTIKSEVYSEPDSGMHQSMIDLVVKDLYQNQLGEDKNISILDIGCGQGYAMEMFKEYGFENCQGITMSEEDVEATIKRGFKCENMDQSFMTFEDSSFDFLFSRHCLEHSPFPYFTLKEYYRVCKEGGKVYIEMPAGDNTRPLEDIPNHYSIMGARMWIALMARVGWKILVSSDFTMNLTDERTPDKPFDEKNLVFVLQK